MRHRNPHLAETDQGLSSGRLGGRPKARRDQARPGTRGFQEVLTDLAETRSRYEHLRSTAGHFDERAILVSALHDLRAEAASVRLRSGLI